MLQLFGVYSATAILKPGTIMLASTEASYYSKLALLQNRSSPAIFA